MPIDPKRLASKQLDDIVWFIFSLGSVALICVVWALILPLFGPGPETGANVLGLALTYLTYIRTRTLGAVRNGTGKVELRTRVESNETELVLVPTDGTEPLWLARANGPAASG